MFLTAWDWDDYYIADAESLVPRSVHGREGDWQYLHDTYGSLGLAQRYREPALCAITAGRRDPSQLVLRWTDSAAEVVIDEGLRIAVEERSPRKGRVRYQLSRGGESWTLDVAFKGRLWFAFDKRSFNRQHSDEHENIIVLATNLARRPDDRAHYLSWMLSPRSAKDA